MKGVAEITKLFLQCNVTYEQSITKDQFINQVILQTSVASSTVATIHGRGTFWTHCPNTQNVHSEVHEWDTLSAYCENESLKLCSRVQSLWFSSRIQFPIPVLEEILQ